MSNKISNKQRQPTIKTIIKKWQKCNRTIYKILTSPEMMVVYYGIVFALGWYVLTVIAILCE